MIVNLKELTSALQKIQYLVGNDKTITGIMFDIGDNEMKVVYSNGYKTLVEKMDIINEEGDVKNKIVFDYKRLIDLITVCQPTGNIVTEDLQFTFTEGQVVEILAEQKLPIPVDDEETEVTYLTHGTIKQLIRYDLSNASTRVAVLDRVNYEDVFGDSETSDTWNIEEFRSEASKLCSEKDKTVYFSPKSQFAFVVNTAYTTCVPFESTVTQSLVIKTGLLKSIVDILSKVPTETNEMTLRTVNNHFCYIKTEDEKLAIWFEMTKGDKMHLTALERFANKEFKTVQLTFIKEILAKNIKSATLAGKVDRTTLKFRDSSYGEKEMYMEVSSGGSISNGFTTDCVEVFDPNNVIDNLELGVILKSLDEIALKCDNYYITLDVDIDEAGNKFLRLGDLSREKREAVAENARANLGLYEGQEIPQDVLMNTRNKTLNTISYAVAAKA